MTVLRRCQIAPLRADANLGAQMEQAVRQWQGVAAGEIVGEAIFNLLLAKFYDEMIHCAPNDAMDFFARPEDAPAQTARRLRTLVCAARGFYHRQCETLAFAGELALNDGCLHALALLLQPFCLQDAGRPVAQELYMRFAPPRVRAGLNQFYTPASPVRFAAAALNIGVDDKFIDPACGTGDFVAGVMRRLGRASGAEKNAYAWDLSGAVCELAAVNLIACGGLPRIENVDSLQAHDKMNGAFRFVITNPPFGKSDKISDESILRRYALRAGRGPGASGVEIGVLFVERCMNLLREGGISCIVLPDSYLTLKSYNFLRQYLFDNHRLLAVIKLPDITFELTSAKPKTSLVFLQKGGADAQEEYEIFLFNARHIGFKIKKKRAEDLVLHDANGGVVTGEDGRSVLIDDLQLVQRELAYFAYKNGIAGLVQSPDAAEYASVKKSAVRAAASGARNAIYIKRLTPAFAAALRVEDARAYSLESCCEIDRGRSPRAAEMTGARCLYVDTRGAERGSYVATRWSWRYLPERARVFDVQAGDVFVATQNGDRNFVVIKDANERAFFSSGFIRVRIADASKREDFLCFVQSERWAALASGLAVGSTQEDFKVEDFVKILIAPATPAARTEALARVAQMTRRVENSEMDRINDEFYEKYRGQ